MCPCVNCPCRSTRRCSGSGRGSWGGTAVLAAHRAQRHHVADLGEELVPALVGEELAGRPALHRAAVRESGCGTGWWPDRRRSAEVVVVGQPLGIGARPSPRETRASSLAFRASAGIGVCSRSRGMRWENLAARTAGCAACRLEPAAKALRRNGLSPFLHASTPLLVKRPHRKRSRRVIWPCERAFTISARLSLAFCASLIRFVVRLAGDTCSPPSVGTGGEKSRTSAAIALREIPARKMRDYAPASVLEPISVRAPRAHKVEIECPDKRFSPQGTNGRSLIAA